MELKPIKEKKQVLYPTIKDVPKYNFVKEMLLAVAVIPDSTGITPVYVTAYVVPSYMFEVNICKIIRGISIVTTIVSAILLFINKKKINKCLSENEVLKKLNKHRKIKWWIFGISIALIVITSLVIVYIENYM